MKVTEPAPPLREGSPAESQPAKPKEASFPGPAGAVSAAARESARDAAKNAARDAAKAGRRGADAGEKETADATSKQPARKSVTDMALEREAAAVLDEWHTAAAVGDRERYVGHLTKDIVFMGTDQSERWDYATLTSYVDANFRPGSGWRFTPFDRHLLLSPSKEVAWFDERLERNGYSALRGTGVLRREGDAWKIAYYSMTYTIPNEVRSDVEGVVRDGGR